MITEITVFNMVKRYLAGAIVGLIVTMFTAAGINELPPEQLENIQSFVDTFLVFVFYVVTVVYKTWRQKAKLDKGEIVPERVDSL